MLRGVLAVQLSVNDDERVRRIPVKIAEEEEER